MPHSYSKCLERQKDSFLLDLSLILKPIEAILDFSLCYVRDIMEYGYLRLHWIILFVIASEWSCLTKSEVNLDPPESGRRRFCWSRIPPVLLPEQTERAKTCNV